MISAILAFSIAFPGAGRQLPYVERAYMIGAVERGASELTVRGRPVEIYRTGAWATVVDAVEGTNTVECVYSLAQPGGGTVRVATNHVFRVANRLQPPPKDAAGGAAAPAPEKKWEKLEYCSDEPRKHPSGRAPSEIAIVVDPGHGGSDTGALSPHGLFEKNANLILARAVRDALAERGFNVRMTREDDRALVLTERPRLAHEIGADAFISIHHNAPAANQDPRSARYTAVYAWNPLGERLASHIAGHMAAALDGDVPSKGVLHANFAVTRNPEIPSCLVETDFMTSPQGEEAIFNHARQHFIAEAIAEAVAEWAK